MKKNVIFLLVLLTVVIVCAGCLSSDTKLLSIYLLPDASGPQLFREDAPTAEQIPNFSPDTVEKEQPETREVLFDGKLRELILNPQLTGEWDVYSSGDNTITCWFEPGSGMLRMISAEGWLDPNLALEMDEDDYINWVHMQVAEYYTENWDEYTLSCTTELRDTYTGRATSSTTNGFVSPFDEYESISSYTFTFTKYLGDYATSDLIRAYIRPDSGLAVLEFSGHNFDGAKPIDVDTDLIHASIYQFLTDSIAETEYSYIKHSSMRPRLAYVQNRLCYICTISIEVVTLDDNDKFENHIVLQPVAIVLN